MSSSVKSQFSKSSLFYRTINCFDLQELLEACLPNDYIRSCANLGKCLMMKNDDH